MAHGYEWKGLLPSNEFKWTEKFKVFLVDSLHPGEEVSNNLSATFLTFEGC
jgi:hypothetical protein